MKNEITTFNKEGFGEIRTLTIDNEPWFVGKDIAIALGYNNPRDALSKRVYIEDKGVANCDTLGGKQDLVIINESGLYSLILSSKLPRAKEFKHWVTSEALPTIRKTGGYHVPKGKELLALALVEANNTITAMGQENFGLKTDIAHKTEEIVDLRPRAVFADRITSSKDTISMNDMALLITQNGKDMTRAGLFKWMRDNGYIYKRSTKAKQKYVKEGLFKLHTFASTGGYKIFSSTRITGKGQKHFLKKILPNSEV